MPSQGNRHLAAIIGANIRRERLARDLTQREVAQAIGVESIFISRWERGEHSPNEERLHLLADLFFDGDVSALFRDPDAEPVAA
jgi:transcriptional regulator with XRE-family HTH domain